MQGPYFPPPPPPPKSSPVVVLVLVVGGLLVASVLGVIGWSAVTRYRERALEAKRSVEDARDDAEHDDPPSRTSASAAPSPSGSDVAPLALDLGAQGTLTFPPGSTIVQRDVGLQDNQATDAFVSVPGRRMPILVFAEKPTGTPCKAALQKNRHLTESVPEEAKALFHVEKMEDWRSGGLEGIYTELSSRKPAEAKAGAPFRPGAGVLLCGKTALVNITLMGEGATLSDAERTTLRTIASTLVAKP